MGRPRTVSDDTILEAARAVFLEFGPSASTTTIAERCGLSQAALFKRFGTKHDLMFKALAPPDVPTFVAQLDAGPVPGEPMQEQLRSVSRVIARFFRDMVPCLMVLRTSDMDLMEQFAQMDVPPPVRAHQAVHGWLQRGMDAGELRMGDPVSMTASLLGAFHMRAFLTHLTHQPYDDVALDAYVDSVVDSLWNGLAPEAP